MASQFVVTGPVQFWVGLGTGSTIASPVYVFLGFTDTGVTFAFNPQNEDIQVDYAGAVPGEVSQLGMDANISGTFTRFDPVVSLAVSAMVGNSGSPPNVAGTYFNNQMGSLWNLENVAYGLLAYFPYTAKTEFANEVKGYYFPVTNLANPTQFVASVRRKAPEFSFRAVPLFGTFSGSTFLPNTAPWNASMLFSNNNSYFASLPNVD